VYIKKKKNSEKSKNSKMPRKKPKQIDPIEEMENTIKLLCDQSKNHMKVREYDKALAGYNQVICDRMKKKVN